MAVEPQIGRVIAGKYRLEHSLGAGGMGKVVAATHLGLGRKVALKFMRLGVLDNAEAMGRFMREARAAAALRSEHVARVMDVEIDAEGGAPYIVMEYLEGRDLGAIVELGPVPAVAESVGYVLQACEGLAEAHAKGIVHRDLKPANLFLTRRPDGTPLVKVLDFGVSKLNQVTQSGALHLTGPSRALGSPLYMSPEQMVASPHVDQRADIWALGVILYELLSGKPPFDAGTLLELGLAIASQPHPPLADQVPGLAPGLAAVVDRCLQKKPAARFPDLAGLAAALVPYAGPDASASAARIAGTLGVRAPAAQAVAPAGPRLTRRTVAVAGVATMLVVGVAVFGWLRVSAGPPARAPAAAAPAPLPPAVAPLPAAAPPPTPPRPTVTASPEPPTPPASPAPAPIARKRARIPERAAAAPAPATPRPAVERPAVEEGATRTKRGPVVTDL